MARKKGRLTHKKKSGEPTDKMTPNGISAQKFASFAREFGSFLIEDADHVQHTFCKGDLAYIQYQDLGDNVAVPEDHWIGEIQMIRADRSDDVWVRVQWLWSPQEVAEAIKSFKPTICGKYEKLSSDNSDIISVHCFVRHVNVKRFDERCIYQPSIGEDEWFFRYTFLYNGRRISPKVTHDACPICKIPYTPGVEKILHFCPRPNCRNFYHQSCLIKDGYVQETRAHRVLETWPEVDRTVSVEQLCGLCPDSEPRRKRLKTGRPTSKESDWDPLADFPPQLIAVAEQPIVRGTKGGNVVGNITAVAAARQLIFKTLGEGSVIPDNWEKIVDVSEAFPETDTLPNCFCPGCFSPI